MSSTSDVLSECLATAIEITPKVIFDAENFRHLYPVALYSSVLELVDECLYLNREGPKPGIPLLSRSILEAFVNLKNVTSDENYVEYIEWEWLNSWLKLMNQAGAGNVYLGKIAESTDLEENRKKYHERLKELEEKGIGRLSIYDKFEKAELQDEYRTIYGFMSAHSHGSLQALLDKHIDVSSGRPQVSAFEDRSIDEFDAYLGTTCEIFALATELFHQYFETDFGTEVKEIRTKVDAHKDSMISA